MAICENKICKKEVEDPIVVNGFTSCPNCSSIFEHIPEIYLRFQGIL
jgi:hypothetical protein